MHVVREFGNAPAVWEDCTVDGECSNCGGCCGNLLPLDDTDIRILKKYMKEHGIKPIQKVFFNPAHIDNTCPFRDEATRSCIVYPARPEICKEFVCNKTGLETAERMAKKRMRLTKRMVNMRKEFGGWDK